MRDLKTRDVVIGILSYLPKSTNRISNSRFHKEIFRIRNRSRKYKDLFKGLAFSTNSSNPYSEPLEQILMTLAMSELLGRNCDWTWHVTDALKNHYGESLRQSFTPGEQKAIQRMGGRLAEKIERGELAPLR